jgi:HEAT repeat protein
MRTRRYSYEFLLVASALTMVVCASAQELQGRFYLEKGKYMLGEPVLFNVDIKNVGSEAVYANAKNPRGCVDRYEFFITGRGSGCGENWVPDCQDDTEVLKPGESIHGQWELDSWYQFEREGTYEVTATRHLPIQSIRGDFQDFTFSSKFEVTLEAPDPVRVQEILQQFEGNLHNNDPEVRHSALDVLATTAPAYFQNTALTLSRDKDPFVVFHAAAALGRINTPETRAALADIITSRESTNEYEMIARIRALEGLGHSGDDSYLSLVSHYMDDSNEHIQLIAMIAVVELGKGPVVPQVQRFLLDPNPVHRKNAAQALRFSTTPEAVGALIGAISDKDTGVKDSALASLAQLTGHSVTEAKEGANDPVQLQDVWRIWWRNNKTKFVFTDLIFLCHVK